MDLRAKAAEFAQEVQETLEGVLPGNFQVVSIAHGGRYVVRPHGANAAAQRIPLFIDREELASLAVQIYLDEDSSGRYLKTWLSKLAIYSTLDRTPLMRQEFDASVSANVPMSHWHVHADRGALSHLLGRAHAIREDRVKKPHDMSSLHFPVGGERFRPCLEDMLEFLVRECGVDHKEGWSVALQTGRERWRRMQFRASVRDLQDEAADVLIKQGWSVQPPSNSRTESASILNRW